MVMLSEKQKKSLNGGRTKPKSMIFRAAKGVAESFKANPLQSLRASAAVLLVLFICSSPFRAHYEDWKTAKKSAVTAVDSAALRKSLEKELVSDARNGMYAEVEKALAAGADPNTRDSLEHSTALIEFAKRGDIKGCALLLENKKGTKIDMDSKDGFGETALSWAEIYKKPGVVGYLKGMGAKEPAIVNKSMTKIDSATAKKELQDDLESSVVAGIYEYVEQNLAAGADVHATDENGWTPLIMAAQDGNAKICGLLIRKGAKINVKDKDGTTVLMWAAQSGDIETCALLIEEYARTVRHDINKVKKFIAAKNGNMTALSYAEVEEELSGKIGLCNYLKFMGAME